MLVLSRQRDESIIILVGEPPIEIEVTVVDIRGDKVRLGINAPNHITIHRKEIWMAIKRGNAPPPRKPPTKKKNKRANPA